MRDIVYSTSAELSLRELFSIIEGYMPVYGLRRGQERQQLIMQKKTGSCLCSRISGEVGGNETWSFDGGFSLG